MKYLLVCTIFGVLSAISQGVIGLDKFSVEWWLTGAPFYAIGGMVCYLMSEVE